MTITPRMDRFVDCSESPNTRPTHCSRFQFKANDYLRGDVRKTGQFTHVSSFLGNDVSGKRFNTHVSSKLRGLVRGKRFISHGRRNWGGGRLPGIERQCNMTDRKREIA